MPLLVALPILIGAIIYGFVKLYATIAAQLGWLAGIGAILLVAALAAALIALLVRRYRAIHGAVVNGKRTLIQEGAWGKILVHTDQKRVNLQLNGRNTQFIFADIAEVRPLVRDETWSLALRLKYSDQTRWDIPMKNGRQARRWAKILSLAAAQKL